MAKILFILGESGAGKTSLEKYLVDNYGFRTFDKLSSRPKRDDDSGYFHFSAQEICDMYISGLVQECIKYDGNFYAFRIPSHTEDDKFVVVCVESGFQQLIDMGIEDKFEIESVFLVNHRCGQLMKKRGDSEESIANRLKLNDRMLRWRGSHVEVDASCGTDELADKIKTLYPNFFLT